MVVSVAESHHQHISLGLTNCVTLTVVSLFFVSKICQNSGWILVKSIQSQQPELIDAGLLKNGYKSVHFTNVEPIFEWW